MLERSISSAFGLCGTILHKGKQTIYARAELCNSGAYSNGQIHWSILYMVVSQDSARSDYSRYQLNPVIDVEGRQKPSHLVEAARMRQGTNLGAPPQCQILSNFCPCPDYVQYLSYCCPTFVQLFYPS